MADDLDAELYREGRRRKRRFSFWRVVGALLLLVLAFVAGRASGLVGGLSGPHVVRIPVTGLITTDRKRIDAIARFARDDSVVAAIVYVDSPGGTVGGGEALYDALTRLAAKKPLVTVMGGTAASAGYMTSLPAARIFALDSTLTGSIGVILETGNVAGLLDRIGVSAEAITSGPLKDQPSFTRGLTTEGRAYLHELVMDLYGQFVAKVAAGRHMDEAAVRLLADGRAYTGRQALKLGLVDEIGGETQARAWLAREKHVSQELPVVEMKAGSFLERTFGAALPGIWPFAWSALLPQAGAWAIWQPGAS